MSPDPMLAIEGLRLDYAIGARIYHALKGIDLAIAAGEFFTLLGPSGCGKTTTLRSVAGLEYPTHGSIRIAGRPVFDAAQGIRLPANRRDLSMVFQSYAIWPHMTVGENVGFPIETAGLSRADRTARVLRALAMVGLDQHLDRPASLLSGGQQQRVALARALVRDSDLLLLDEPLSNLDAQLREQMRGELRALQQRVGKTTLYVTHDQDEALAMSDRMALMRAGEIIEIGTPDALYFRPKRRFTAEFLGRTVLLPGRPIGPQGAGFAMATAIGPVVAGTGLAAGDNARCLAIRPEHIRLSDDPPPAVNGWRGRVAERVFSGRLVEYQIEIGDQRLTVQTLSDQMAPVGADITIILPCERCLLLDE
jgi:iron(III) transport system ATP-binding protein